MGQPTARFEKWLPVRTNHKLVLQCPFTNRSYGWMDRRGVAIDPPVLGKVVNQPKWWWFAKCNCADPFKVIWPSKTPRPKLAERNAWGRRNALRFNRRPRQQA